MQYRNRKYYISVSDLALCQKCPALLAYKTHFGKKSAWKVGIKGNGEAYGSIFHKYIARVFFEGASNYSHYLHQKIAYAVSGGETALENMVRENIFMPFIAKHSQKFKSENLIAMARGVTVWVKAMSEFFRCIPSLSEYSESDMRLIFKEPEQRLQSTFNFDDGCTLFITGCYDALMFNPDRSEARLFEFKAYKKGDATVPLSQSLIYSWLIWRKTGIVPAIEIIYLGEEDKQPDIFDSQSVRSMIRAALPNLFHIACSIISLREVPEILQNINLCPVCRYRGKCKDDIAKIFAGAPGRSRKGSSLVNVLVFFLIALMITTQAFFFLVSSSESLSEERGMMQVSLKLDDLIETAKNAIETGKIRTIPTSPNQVSEKNFYDETRVWEKEDSDMSVNVFNLYYNFNSDKFNENAEREYKKIFPPLGENYFLIRASCKLSMGNYIMRQVVVYLNDTTTTEKSTTTEKLKEEVFYWDAN